VISNLSQLGEMIYLAIVSDCTGIRLLGTFTFAILIVANRFEDARTRYAGLIYLIGYISKILANLLRIFTIAISCYIHGSSRIIENYYSCLGWIVFPLWMKVFWIVFFFARILHFNPLALLKKMIEVASGFQNMRYWYILPFTSITNLTDVYPGFSITTAYSPRLILRDTFPSSSLSYVLP